MDSGIGIACKTLVARCELFLFKKSYAAARRWRRIVRIIIEIIKNDLVDSIMISSLIVLEVHKLGQDFIEFSKRVRGVRDLQDRLATHRRVAIKGR
jgi:hypothetical protein